MIMGRRKTDFHQPVSFQLVADTLAGEALELKVIHANALGVYVWIRADSYRMYPFQISPYSGRKKNQEWW